jgi:hypothetical protein
MNRLPFDPDSSLPPAHRNAPEGTSDDAARRIAPRAKPLRDRVFEYVRARGPEGATDREIQAALELHSDTEVPRRYELVKAEKLVNSGRKRKTPSGCSATVWVTVEHAKPAPVTATPLSESVDSERRRGGA